MRFTEKNDQQVITIHDDPEPPTKRSKTDEPEKRLDTLNDCMATDVQEIRDADELEVYGNEKQTSMQITSYNFEVVKMYFS